MDSGISANVSHVDSIAISRDNERDSEIINEILQRKRTFKDFEDLSIYPSYTQFQVPYHITCRMRYSKKKHEYEEQFQRELDEMINHQPTAYEAARLNRHLCITSLWPPLHNRKEIDHFQRNFFHLSAKQKNRLNFLMRTKLN